MIITLKDAFVKDGNWSLIIITSQYTLLIHVILNNLWIIQCWCEQGQLRWGKASRPLPTHGCSSSRSAVTSFTGCISPSNAAPPLKQQRAMVSSLSITNFPAMMSTWLHENYPYLLVYCYYLTKHLFYFKNHT